VLVVPSPKCHCQEVGDPVDVSVNWTDCPALGGLGLYLNDAAKPEGITMIVRLSFPDPAPMRAVKITR